MGTHLCIDYVTEGITGTAEYFTSRFILAFISTFLGSLFVFAANPVDEQNHA